MTSRHEEQQMKQRQIILWSCWWLTTAEVTDVLGKRVCKLEKQG